MINLEIKVTAGAKSNGFKRKKGFYFLRIKAKAVDGKANKALIEFLANELNINKKDVEIIKGEKSGRKIISINIDENVFNEYFEDK